MVLYSSSCSCAGSLLSTRDQAAALIYTTDPSDLFDERTNSWLSSEVALAKCLSTAMPRFGPQAGAFSVPPLLIAFKDLSFGAANLLSPSDSHWKFKFSSSIRLEMLDRLAACSCW